MDAFKRVYSNNDTATVAIPYFWENFNKEDFSVWLAEYQYNEDLRMVFMACNLVGGMFQRIEKLRKTAFASVGIFGKDNAAAIEGIWICRTQELAFNVGVKILYLHTFFCRVGWEVGATCQCFVYVISVTLYYMCDPGGKSVLDGRLL